jgi:hypothetical protein
MVQAWFYASCYNSSNKIKKYAQDWSQLLESLKSPLMFFFKAKNSQISLKHIGCPVVSLDF